MLTYDKGLKIKKRTIITLFNIMVVRLYFKVSYLYVFNKAVYFASSHSA